MNRVVLKNLHTVFEANNLSLGEYPAVISSLSMITIAFRVIFELTRRYSTREIMLHNWRETQKNSVSKSKDLAFKI